MYPHRWKGGSALISDPVTDLEQVGVFPFCVSPTKNSSITCGSLGSDDAKRRLCHMVSVFITITTLTEPFDQTDPF